MLLKPHSEIGLKLYEKYKAMHPIGFYTGILALQGLAHLAVDHDDEELVERVRQELLPFLRLEVDCASIHLNFQNYLCGGNATAYMAARGFLDEARECLERYGAELLHEARRSKEGVFSMPRVPDTEKIWIDAAFAVVPFLVNAGVCLGNERFVAEGADQIAGLYDLLIDRKNGLLHQSRGFAGPGLRSQDHWSRGNGWGILALAEIINALEANHPERKRIEPLFKDLCEACFAHADKEGLWHQEMTVHESYVETSGSALIHFGIGVGIAHGLLPEKFEELYERSFQSLLQYMDEEGNISNTCVGCLSPKQGRIEDYMKVSHKLNDRHAFGAYILALSQYDHVKGNVS